MGLGQTVVPKESSVLGEWALTITRSEAGGDPKTMHCISAQVYSLLRRSQSYSRLYLQFNYMTFLYSQLFKFQLVVNLSPKMVFL